MRNSPSPALELAVPRRSRTLDAERLGAHVDHLHRAAWAMCGDPHDAEDLVQETFARC